VRYSVLYRKWAAYLPAPSVLYRKWAAYLPAPSVLYRKFQQEISEEIPHDVLYCGRLIQYLKK